MPDKRPITIPFAYEIEGVRRGRKVPERFVVIDSVLSEVESVTADQAPIVVDAPNPPAGWTPFDMRVHDGILYGAVDSLRRMPANGQEIVNRDHQRHDYSYEDYEAAARAMIAGDERFAMPNYPVAGARMSNCDFFKGSTEASLELRSISSSDREQVALKASASADKAFLLVDGVLYAREGEPRWAVEGYYDQGRRTYVVQMQIVRARSYSARGTELFRMDRLDDAIVYARTKAERLGVPLELIPDGSVAVDRSGHAWKLEDDVATARSWLREAVSTIASYGDQILAASDTVVEHYLDMRRASKEPDLLPAVVVTMMDRMDELLPTMPTFSGTFRQNYAKVSEKMRLRDELFGLHIHGRSDAPALDDLHVMGPLR